MADKLAARGALSDPEMLGRLRDLCRALFAFYRDRYLPAEERPLLTGRDLVGALGLPPGPRIGALLARARTLQIEGKLTTRDEALQWAEKAAGRKR
jgi:hypothetical protein